MNELPPEALGPKMLALRDDRQRRFVWLMACGEHSAAKAARTAGYSDVKEGAKVRAHFLMHSAAVLDAIDEASRKVLRGLAPLAIRAAKEILLDPSHPSHGRILETIMDRTGHFAETKHTMRVEHTVDTKDLVALAHRLAAESGIDPRRLLGVGDGPGLLIEGQATEVADEAVREDR